MTKIRKNDRSKDASPDSDAVSVHDWLGINLQGRPLRSAFLLPRHPCQCGIVLV